MIEINKSGIPENIIFTEWLDAMIEKQKEFDELARLYEKDGIYSITGLSAPKIHIRGVKRIADALGLEIIDDPEWDDDREMGRLSIEYKGYEVFELYDLEEKG